MVEAVEIDVSYKPFIDVSIRATNVSSSCRRSCLVNPTNVKALSLLCQGVLACISYIIKDTYML